MNLYSESYPALAKDNTLFIHGNLASCRWWHPTLKSWRQAGSLGQESLHMVDWRGCGQNDPWPGDRPFGIEDLAQDFIAWMDSKELETVSLVGHSLGGLIAQQMMIMQPKRFTKVLLLDPVSAKGVVFDDKMYEAFRQMARSRELTRTVILSTIQHSQDLDLHTQEAFADDAFKAVRGIGSSVLEILKSVDLSDALKDVRIPTLILHGQLDAVLPLSGSQELVRLLPNAKLEILPDAGHCWNIEDTGAFTTRLRTFV